MAKKKNSNDVIFDNLCDSILAVIKSFCTKLNNSKNESDRSKRIKEKKDSVSDFQKNVLDELNKRMNDKWDKEHIKTGAAANDRVDIFCKVKRDNWVIEIDTSRADQVAKKAFSRFALYGIDSPIFYVAVIYPGTSSMNLNEVMKYSRYGYDIAKALNDDNDFRTIIIDCEQPCLRILRFVKNMKFIVNGEGDYSMTDAIEKATQIYLNGRGKSFYTLKKELEDFEGLNNHNGQDTIVSEIPQTKKHSDMKDNKGKDFYLSNQWMFFGKDANFDAIIRFFKNKDISIEPKLELKS